MRSFWFTLVLAACVALALPVAVGALGLTVEANAGGGLGLGSTNNPNETGSPRAAVQAGLEADLFLLSLGPVDLGIGTGLEYDNMSNYGTVTQVNPGPIGPPPFTQNIDSNNNYVYLIVPLVITSRIQLSQGMNLTLSAGGFYGFFMGGQATNVSSSVYGSLPNETFNSSNVPGALLGLHFSGGVDFGLGGGFSLSPLIIFNMGLTNITGFPPLPFNQNNYTYTNNGTTFSTYTDSLWSLSLLIGIKYNVF